MKTEKEILLAVATREEWDCWLTKVSYDLSFGAQDCLFCKAFGGKPGLKQGSSCYSCMPGKSDGELWPCNQYNRLGAGVRIDAAIERLEKAGVFDE